MIVTKIPSLRSLLASAGAVGALLASALAAPAWAASPGSDTIVAMGDSFISGEAGRWEGNSTTVSGSRDGTDRAYIDGRYRPAVIYGETYQNGCDRSDVAEIQSPEISAKRRINLACSGAQTWNLLPATAGGVPFKGQAPQIDQLATVAKTNTVSLIAISIGGNDLGFPGIISSCAQRFSLFLSECADQSQKYVDAAMPDTMNRIGDVIDQTRAVMTADGYADDDYRIVLQSVPIPLPPSSQMRYPETGWSRDTTGGCPFYNTDIDWARSVFGGQFVDDLALVAGEKNVQFLDLSAAFRGHELCSTTTELASPGVAPSEATSEWVRFLGAGFTQGTANESIHPNAFGQRVLGRCLKFAIDNPGTPALQCVN